MDRRALRPEDPQRLGEYWPAARLGSGAQGVVFEAYDPAGRRVAVKMLHPRVASGPAARARFAKEVRAAQRVASFCTARVLDADTEAESPYIVSEFVPGPDLAAAVRAAGPLREDALLRLVTGVVTALAAIHQAGVVHRDLKPGNVLLGPDGPRVIDFGIARITETTLTDTGASMGTVGYLAPEILQGRPADAAADVFAWGAVVLYAATGTEPFRGENLGEIVVRALEHHPDLSVLPEPLQPLVGAALAKRPEQRPSSATLLLRLLSGPHDPGRALQAGARAAARSAVPSLTVRVPTLGEAAEDAYRALPPAARTAAREVWLRLVVPGSAADGSHDTVRTARTEELLAGRPEEEQECVRQVLATFGDAGVLGREPSAVRPVGAALLRAWPRLREWADTDREALRVHRHLGQAARAWQHHGQRPDDLARGTALRDTLGWAATAPARLRPNAVERAFLRASQAAEGRRTRRVRLLNTVLAGALVLLLITTGLALWQRQSRLDAQHQGLSRLSEQLAAQSGALIGTNPDLAALLAVQAYRTSPTAEAAADLSAVAALPLRHRLTGHTDAVWSVAVSPDGRTLASGSKDNTVRLWDAATGSPGKTLTGHTAVIIALQFSPDGRTLATCSRDRTVRLWDVATGTLRRTLAGHTGDVNSASFSPDGKILATAAADRTVRLWDAATGAPRRTLTGHTNAVNMVVFSRDGKTLATVGDDRTLRFWDAATGALGKTLTGHTDAVQEVRYSPDGKILATASRDSTVRLWDAATGRSRRTLTGHTATVFSVAFSPDGRSLATGSQDKTVRLWDVATGTLRETLTGHTDAVLSVAFTPDGRTLATAGRDETVRLWDVTTGTRKTLTGHSGAVLSVAFAPDGRTLATDGRDRTVRLWDAATGRLRRELTGHTGAVNAVAFAPDGRTLATAGADRTVRLWDAATGRPRKELTGHTDSVNSVVFSPDGRTLATAAADRAVRLWDAATGRPRKELTGHTDAVNAVAFSPDGRTLATAAADETVRLWDAATGTLRRTLTGHTDAVLSVAFSPDGRTLATAGWDRMVRLWDAGTGTPREILTGHTDNVNAVAFSPDGGTLATVGSDRTVRLWDTGTGILRDTLTGHTGGVDAVAFSPDGRTVTTGGEDRTVRLWTVHISGPEEAGAKVCSALRRDFTPEERSMYLPGQSVAPVCG